jgi:hypothetical protein
MATAALPVDVFKTMLVKISFQVIHYLCSTTHIYPGILKAGLAAGAAAGRAGSCPKLEIEINKIVTNVTNAVFTLSFIFKSPNILII